VSNSYNPAQGMTPFQIAQFYQQQGLQAQMQSMLSGTQQRHLWMWNGVAMPIEDFAQHAYGDTPEATVFLLKYKDVI